MGWFIKAIRLNEITKTISREEGQVSRAFHNFLFNNYLLCQKKEEWGKKVSVKRPHRWSENS